MFSLLGVPVYHADIQARRLMQEDPDLKEGITALFGVRSFNPAGVLDRKFIAEIVFHDPDKLRALNDLVHPATLRDAADWARDQQGPYILKEAALIFETEAFRFLDRVIVVQAPLSLRIRRVMDRDSFTRDEVMVRVARQLDERITIKLADHVILNDEHHLVISQVLDIHALLLRNAENPT